MEEEKIIQFPDEDILMEFRIGNQEYAIIKKGEDESGMDLVYYVKIDEVDGVGVARSIDDDEEYERVEQKANEILSNFKGDEEND